MTAVDDELMRPSVCGTIPVLREKDGVGFGSLKQSCSESRSSVRSPCGFVVFASSFWWLGWGAREGSPVSARIARSATRSSHRHPLAGGEVVVANRNPWRPSWLRHSHVRQFCRGSRTTQKLGSFSQNSAVVPLICGPSARITQGGRFDFF